MKKQSLEQKLERTVMADMLDSKLIVPSIPPPNHYKKWMIDIPHIGKLPVYDEDPECRSHLGASGPFGYWYKLVGTRLPCMVSFGLDIGEDVHFEKDPDEEWNDRWEDNLNSKNLALAEQWLRTYTVYGPTTIDFNTLLPSLPENKLEKKFRNGKFSLMDVLTTALDDLPSANEQKGPIRECIYDYKYNTRVVPHKFNDISTAVKRIRAYEPRILQKIEQLYALYDLPRKDC